MQITFPLFLDEEDMMLASVKDVRMVMSSLLDANRLIEDVRNPNSCPFSVDTIRVCPVSLQLILFTLPEFLGRSIDSLLISFQSVNDMILILFSPAAAILYMLLLVQMASRGALKSLSLNISSLIYLEKVER